MKSLSKKAIVASVVAIIAVPSVALGAWQVTHKPAPTVKEEPVAAQSINPIIYPTAPETPAQRPSTPVEETPVSAPVILSNQEYANKYLNLSTERYQSCYGIIMESYSSRFTESTREANFKKMSGPWAAICASKVLIQMNADGTPHRYIELLGLNGEFFDR